VFTARYALSPYIKQIRFVFKGLITWQHHAVNSILSFSLYKGKAIPVQAWRAPWASRRLRFPEFIDNRHTKVSRLSASRTDRLYSPGDILGTQRLSRLRGHSAAGRIKSMKNFIFNTVYVYMMCWFGMPLYCVSLGLAIYRRNMQKGQLHSPPALAMRKILRATQLSIHLAFCGPQSRSGRCPCQEFNLVATPNYIFSYTKFRLISLCTNADDICV
jgi:hypothetical protein